jgi:hypothetical protein
MPFHPEGKVTRTVVVLLALSIAGCSDSDERSDVAPRDTHLAQHLRLRSAGGDRAVWYADIDEAMPSAQNEGRFTGGSTDLVVTGRFTAAEPGLGFVDNLDPDPGERGSTPVSFDDTSAQWRSLHLTFVVDRVLGGAARNGDTLHVGLAVSGGTDSSTFLREATLLGQVVVFLHRSPVFDYDKTLWAIVADGGMLATYSASGDYDFVFLDEGYVTPLANSETFEALLAAKG